MTSTSESFEAGGLRRGDVILCDYAVGSAGSRPRPWTCLILASKPSLVTGKWHIEWLEVVHADEVEILRWTVDMSPIQAFSPLNFPKFVVRGS